MIAMDGRRVVVTEHSHVGSREDAIAFTRGDAGWVATTRLRRANLLECSGIGVDVSLAIVGKLVVAGCPNAPTPHPVFEGKVRADKAHADLKHLEAVRSFWERNQVEAARRKGFILSELQTAVANRDRDRTCGGRSRSTSTIRLTTVVRGRASLPSGSAMHSSA